MALSEMPTEMSSWILKTVLTITQMVYPQHSTSKRTLHCTLVLYHYLLRQNIHFDLLLNNASNATAEKTIDELKHEVQHMLTKHVWKPVLWDYHHHIQYVPEEEVCCRWEIGQAQIQICFRGAAAGQKCLL